MYAVRKISLLLVIGATAFFPMLFVDLEEPTTSLVLYKILAKLGSLCGGTLIIWQFLLGFHGTAGKIIPDLLWVLTLHKQIGKYIIFTVVLHPIFITLYYIEKKGINPFLLEGPLSFWVWVLAGEIAFLLFALVVLTSVFWREQLGRTKWYYIHLSSYAALGIVLAHGLAIGTTIEKTGAFYFWTVLLFFTMGFVWYRMACRAGLLSKKYRVDKTERVGPNVTRISCEPLGKRIEPRLGQFVYFRRRLGGRLRPFTVSHYEPHTGELSVTVKALGHTTRDLQSVKAGEIVYIEGPYGIFSQAVLESRRPIVMIAGGIGITSFTRLFEELAKEPNKEVHLFYGNKKRHEIVYKEEMENVEHINVIHVISDDAAYPGETGYITTNLLKKYLSQSLRGYEFLICGPPVMTKKLESHLAMEGVPEVQIHHELFSY